MIEEEGNSGRKESTFGLPSLNFPIFKRRRFLTLDHWCPTIKLGRHHVTLSLYEKKDDINITECDGCCEWHNRVLRRRVLLRAKIYERMCKHYLSDHHNNSAR